MESFSERCRGDWGSFEDRVIFFVWGISGGFVEDEGFELRFEEWVEIC